MKEGRIIVGRNVRIIIYKNERTWRLTETLPITPIAHPRISYNHAFLVVRILRLSNYSDRDRHRKRTDLALPADYLNAHPTAKRCMLPRLEPTTFRRNLASSTPAQLGNPYLFRVEC